MSKRGTTPPRVVLVTRTTTFEELVARHGTRAQAAFFLKTRDQSIEPIEDQHHAFEDARLAIEAAIPLSWRRARVERAELDRFVFEPNDLVVPLGPDGLVANVAKYLECQRVIGMNPSTSFKGVLVQHAPGDAKELLQAAAEERLEVQQRTMVEARLDDGQAIVALNEIFLGHETHQSAKYSLTLGEQSERQSSSGVIVTTGTGATGWASSIHRERRTELVLPRPEEPALAFFVREAWPSPFTGTSLTEGRLEGEAKLTLTCELERGAVVFGDGIEADRLRLAWGQSIHVRRAARSLHLIPA